MEEDTIIHLKFGDMRKAYSFTDEFWDKYEFFSTECKILGRRRQLL